MSADDNFKDDQVITNCALFEEISNEPSSYTNTN